jgi:hypothetical protein
MTQMRTLADIRTRPRDAWTSIMITNTKPRRDRADIDHDQDHRQEFGSHPREQG